MSNSNRFDELDDDETRSVNSDDMGASTAEFIASEDEMDPELGPQGLDILTQGREHVPIFNTSNTGSLNQGTMFEQDNQESKEPEDSHSGERGLPRLQQDGKLALGDQEEESEDSEAEVERVRIRRAERAPLGISARGGGLHKTMVRKELTDSSPTEHDEDLSLAPSLGGAPRAEEQLLPRGEITRLQGHFDRPSWGGGEVTRPFNQATSSRMPPGDEEPGPSKEASRPKLQQDQAIQPPTSTGQEGGVDLNWGALRQDWDEESVMLFNEQSQLNASDELLERAQLVTQETRGNLDELTEVYVARNQNMAEGGNERIAEKRVQVLEQYGQRGFVIPLLSLTIEETKEMALQEGDLMAQVGGATERLWRDIKLSKSDYFKEEDVTGIFELYQTKLDRLENDLAKVMGREAVERIKKHHRMLEGVIGRVKGTHKKAYLLFPKEMAGPIMEWYARGLAMLDSIDKIKENYRDGLAMMSSHFDKYPGPLETDIPELREESGIKRKTGVELGETWGEGSRVKEARAEPTNIQSLARTRGSASSGTGAPFGGTRTEHGSSKLTAATAGAAGYGYRMGSGYQAPAHGTPLLERAGTAGHDQWGFRKGVIVGYDKKAAYEAALDRSMQLREEMEAVEDGSGDGMSDDMTILTAFGGRTRAEVTDTLLAYAFDALGEEGKDTEEVRRIVTENMPPFTLVTKHGQKPNITNAFSKNVKDIKPYCDGEYISMDEWWKALAEMAQDLGLSIPLMCRFLAKTGGLAKGVHDAYKKRVIDMWKDRSSWLTNYDANRDEKALEYWAYIWMDVTVKFMCEFYVVLDNEEVETSLEELCTEDCYAITDVVDPMNRELWKAYQLYKDMLTLLKDRGSDLVNSPQFPINMLKKWLLTQGIGGHSIHAVFVKAVKRLSVDPAEVFPSNHKKTPKQLQQIKAKGPSKATEEVYLLIWEQLKKRARAKEFDYVAANLQQMKMMQDSQSSADGEGEKKKKGASKEKKVNSVATAAPAKAAIPAPPTRAEAQDKGWGYKGYICPTCSLNHDEVAKCPYWDPKAKVFDIAAFLKLKSVRHVRHDGSSIVSEFWKTKLRKHSFGCMRVTDAEGEKIITDLDAAARALPKVSEAERVKLMARSRSSNLTVQGDTQAAALDEMKEQIVALTAEVKRGRERDSQKSTSKPKSSKSSKPKSGKSSKQGKKSSKKSWAESDSDSGAPSLAEDSSSGESDDSEDS